jgi:chitinase
MNFRKNLLVLSLLLLTLAVFGGISFFSAHATASLPTHLLTGYWQNFNNGARCLRIQDVPTTYDIIAVAFADATTTPGKVTFTLDGGLAAALGGYNEAQFIADIQTVKSRGQHVIISVGGQNGTISVSDSTSATNFANSIYALMTKYGFEGVDIDLENGVNATYMGQALRQLSSLAGPDLIITMAPQTIDMQSTGNEYFKLALNIKDILTIVNMQYYNSGSMLGYGGGVYYQGTVDFLTALATIQLENGLRPDQVGLGLPASTSAAGGGYVSPSVVNTALSCLATGSSAGSFRPPHTYPAIRGAMTWSINWDASSGYNFANSVKAHLMTLPGAESPTPAPTVRPTSTPPSGSGVTFYQDANYGGTAVTLGVGDYNLAQLNAAGIPNDWMSSLKIPSGYTVAVYQHIDFGGTVWTFTADTSYVGAACNDQMSSVKITKGTANPTPAPTNSGSGTTWAANQPYKVGDVVTYNGRQYRCIQSHTSLTGWEPPIVPALWQAL